MGKAMLGVALLLTAGCNQATGPTQQEVKLLEEKLDRQEQRIASIETTLVEERKAQVRSEGEIQEQGQRVRNLESFLSAASGGSATVREVYRPADPVVTPAASPSTATSSSSRSTAEKPQRNPISVTSVSAKIQKVSSNYAYYAYQVTVSNQSPEPVKKMVKVRIVDGKGYEVASRSLYETFAPGSRTYTDTVMVDFEKAKDVRGAIAEVNDGNKVTGSAPRLDAMSYRPD